MISYRGSPPAPVCGNRELLILLLYVFVIAHTIKSSYEELFLLLLLWKWKGCSFVTVPTCHYSHKSSYKELPLRSRLWGWGAYFDTVPYIPFLHCSHNKDQLQRALPPAPFRRDGSCSFCDCAIGYCSHNEEQLQGALPPAPACRDKSCSFCDFYLRLLLTQMKSSYKEFSPFFVFKDGSCSFCDLP